MSRWLKALPLALAVATLSLITIGCNTTSQAKIRFIHAIQDANALDIAINGTKEFTSIQFMQLQPPSGYKAVPGGVDTFQGYETGTPTQIFSTSNVKLFAGTNYTVVATGFITNQSSIPIIPATDTNTVPANGIIDFRIINASPSAPSPLDIYIQPAQVQGLTPPATIGALPYLGVSKYIPVPYNTTGSGYTVYVCPAGNPDTVLFRQTIPVGGTSLGSIRTLILTDQQNINQLNPQFMILNDVN